MHDNVEKTVTELDWTEAKRSGRKQQKIFREIFTEFDVMRELADGYALGYRNKKTPLPTLNRHTEYLSRHFSFFHFEATSDEEGKHVWLRITGPPGVAKEYIHGVLNSQIKMPSALRLFFTRGFTRGLKLLASNWRIMPQFLIIGAVKCGTSSLFAYLSRHPNIMPADRKEIYFFSRYYSRGLAWYRSHFPTVYALKREKRNGKEKLVSGEATPDYLIHPHAPRRVFHTIPTVKLILMLRNPVDVAYAFYQQQFRRGLEPLSFEKAIEREASRLDDEWQKMVSDEHYFSFNVHFYSYLFRGIYIDQLMRWLEFFPREQMLVLVSEAFYKDPSISLDSVCDFLDLPPMPRRNAKEYERINYVPYLRMDPKMRQHLVEYFKPHNRRLYDFVGRDLGWDR